MDTEKQEFNYKESSRGKKQLYDYIHMVYYTAESTVY